MIIQNWSHLHSVLLSLSEEELKETINFEVSNFKRKIIIERLHKRYAKLRNSRERPLLMRGEMLL